MSSIIDQTIRKVELWGGVIDNVISEDEKKELSPEEISNILSLTVKGDDTNKIITFICMLNAYTDNSQFNISFRSPSSTGKSYIPLEISSLFPKEDLMKIAYSSPSSFYHDGGTWDDENEIVRVDLERKIMIFIDQPHDELLKRLRPLLSHDERELIYKITDKRERKGLRTKNVLIRGYPSVIFCTAKMKNDEQESTRSFILSPETSSEKIKDSIYLKSLKLGNPSSFNKMLVSDSKRRALKNRIRNIKTAKINDVIIENPEEIAKKFMNNYPRLKPRYSRDFERLFSLIKGFALINFLNRRVENERDVAANETDVKNAFEIWKSISESQELGIPPYIYRIYTDVILHLFRENNKKNDDILGLSRKDIMSVYLDVYGRPINEWQLKNEIIPVLESSGLIVQEKDPDDGRKLLVYVTYPTPSEYIDNENDENSEEVIP